MDEPGFEVAWSADEALIVGEAWLGSGVWMLRCADGRLETVFRRPEGHVAAVDRSGSSSWVVLGTPGRERPGSAYTLFRSPDRGRTWSAAGPVPFSSVAQLEAVSDTELWVHARSALGRSAESFFPAWAIAPDGSIFAFPPGGWHMRVRRP